MAFLFYNIGKANAEIERLSAELEAAKAATPDQALQAQLSEALKSNEEVSELLSAANTEITKLKESLAQADANFQKINGDFAAVLSKLDATCAALNIEGKEAPADKIDAIRAATNNAIAKTGVKITQIPSAGTTAPKPTSAEDLALREQLEAIKNPTERVEFYRKNKQAIDRSYNH